MYPEYVKQASEENEKAALISFQNALAVEQIHHGLYSEALKALQAGADLPVSKVYVCAVCGNTVLVEPPEKCSVCGAPKSKFDEVS